MSGLPIENSTITIRLDFVDQDGTAIEIDAATSIKLKMKNPLGTAVERSMGYVATASKNRAEYEGTFTPAGTWTYQGEAVVAGKTYKGQDERGEPFKLVVKKAL